MGMPQRLAHFSYQKMDSVQPCTLRERLLLLAGRVLFARFRAQRLIRALLQESRSVGYRIRTLYKNKLAMVGVDIGPSLEIDADGHLVRCMRTRACTQDIENLQKQYPWLSLSDLYLCQKAWVAGWETRASRLTCSDTQSQILGQS